MNRAWSSLALVLAGCGPLVAIPGEDGGSGETDAPAGSSSSGDVPIVPTNGTGPGPFTTGPTPTTLPQTSAGVTSSAETGFDSSTSGSTGRCWVSSTVFEAPEEARPVVTDQDGDGTNELWLAFFENDGTELFVFDPSGAASPAGVFPGFFTGFHDVDGDGVEEAVGFAFGGGGPPELVFIPGEPGQIQGDAIPTNLEFDGGFPGFIEATGDGRIDVVRNSEASGTTDLLAGDGMGNFLGPSSVPSPFEGDVSAMAAAEGFLLFERDDFDPVGACVEHPSALLSIGLDSLIVEGVVENPSGLLDTEALAAELVGEGGYVFTRACNPRNGTSALHLTEFEGGLATSTLFVEAIFVAMGDFAGTGGLDMANGADGGVYHRPHQGGTDFGVSTFDEVPYGEPVSNRVFVVDLDLDGRDEIILGTRDGGSEIVYQRLDLEDC